MLPADAEGATMSAPAAEQRIDWPLWWFASLERAVERGDFRTAATALRELERLGVTVTYRGRLPQREEVAHESSR